MIRSRALMALTLTPALALAACDAAQDPMQAPGTWQPKYVNDTNLREMLANPADLVAGQSATGSVASEASSAVQRLVDDRRRPLSGVSATDIKSNEVPATPDSASAAH